MPTVRNTLLSARWIAALGTLLCVATAAAQRPAARPAPRQPAWKGIFEPVSFPADVELNDVFFVTPEVGWATGGNGVTNGVLIATTDGGANWTVQVGDPESSERPYNQLRFVDGRTGFAVQGAPSTQHKLLRTIDGERWAVVGTMHEHRQDYAFVSATVGVTAHNAIISRTVDAGRAWKPVLDCRVKVQTAGLTRDARCYVENFHFPTRRVGYGVAYSPDAPGFFVVKTEDAGETWTAWLAMPEERGREARVFFTDPNRGSACLTNGKYLTTDDGGRTWAVVPGPACEGKPAVRFADPEVGWTVAYSALNFSIDGGRTWSGRAVKFPAPVRAFSLPRRDRGFVVGAHGMIYRYRVIPAADAVPPDALVGPAMPSVSAVLDERVAELDETIKALGEAVAATPGPADAAPAGAGPDAAPEAPAFEQNVDMVPLPTADLPDASPFTTSCCGKPQNRVKLLIGSIISALPQLLERHRNTNTLGGTLVMLVELPLQVTALRDAAAAFWRAPDKAGAQQALAELNRAAGGLKASTAMAFQRQPAFVQ